MEFSDEGTCPIFSFISTRRIVVIAPPREARSSSRDYRRREPGRRDPDHPVSERRHERRDPAHRDERRDPAHRDERRDPAHRDERREGERRDDRQVERRDAERQVERPNSETSNVERRDRRDPAEHRPVRTEAPLPVPAPDQEIHENGGGPSHRRPNQWRPPRPVFYPPPMGYPPMVPPPPWFGPHPPPPRGFVPRGPRHNIRYNN